MPSKRVETRAIWSEEDSLTFLEAGGEFVPDRELQIRTLADLLAGMPAPPRILELACGEGLLAEALLTRYPEARLLGLDGSPVMLERARLRMGRSGDGPGDRSGNGPDARLGDRFAARHFDLAAADWRPVEPTYSAVVSSLALHHLQDDAKRELFRDVRRMLVPGGAFLIADLVEPASAVATTYAAEIWDEAVRQRSAKRAAAERAGSGDTFERFRAEGWNHYRTPDAVDRPARLYDQLRWLEEAGFARPDVFWMKAGHAIYGAVESGR